MRIEGFGGIVLAIALAGCAKDFNPLTAIEQYCAASTPAARALARERLGLGDQELICGG